MEIMGEEFNPDAWAAVLVGLLGSRWISPKIPEVVDIPMFAIKIKNTANLEELEIDIGLLILYNDTGAL